MFADLGPTHSLSWIMAVWTLRIIILSLICTFLSWLGIRVLDALTPNIHEREEIGKNPISTGLFVSGFLILLGLVIHGVLTSKIAMGQSFLGSIISMRRLSLIGVSFFVSIFLGVGLFNLFDRLTPRIQFINVRENPEATGVYVFGYLIFFGLVIHSVLTMSL
ncbi:hypothetical protein AKJ61_04555 [candidate division MSBL1 archaeon SCGC-AAA259B11]|uniref:DUF350 domain-containing protein n=1 Tax=candidate division MSBL1 archaeon SCGC-AAA259B11 TaxID=1698260 RepID=A0A133U347_9EURY|nr:hypothetical protein AKJ61_04555 [candidate division MSBL1 archaeon SCGC-AAA259B11]